MREFKDLLRQVMDEQGLKAVDVSKKTGIGSGAISMYLSGKRFPKRNVIAKFAQGLNVSEAWFLGYDVPMERDTKEDIRAQAETLTDEMSRMMWKEISKIWENSGFAWKVHLYSMIKEAEEKKKK